jgi:hypothetical protein
MHTELPSENLKGRDDLEDLHIDEKILPWIIWKCGRKVWTGSICLRIGISGGLLLT